MSELIDRIFDAEKISAEIKTILDGLKKVEGSIIGVSDAIKTLEKAEIRKAKSSDDLAASSEKLNNEFVKGQKAMKTWEDEVAKLNEKTKQLTETEKQGAIEIAKARLELQAAQKATKDAAVQQIVLDASTKGLKQNYTLLKKELEASAIAYKNLTIAEQKTADGKALLAKYWEIKKAVNGTDEALGNFQHKVGQYENALSNLPGIFGQMASQGQSVLVSLRNKFDSVKDATMSVRDAMAQSREAVAASMAAAEKAAIAEQALATAEKAGAATATLAAEAEAARAVATDAATVATNLGSKAMQIFKVALISTGIGALVVALGAVVAYFTQTNEGSKQFAKISAGISAVLQSGIKILGSYGKLLFAIATFDLKKIKEGWAELGTNIKNATGEIQENYKAGVQNTANQQMMAKREREWSLQKLKLQKEFEDNKILAGKRSKLDDEGKAAAAKKALQINNLIYENDLKIAKNKAKMVEDEQKLVSKKDYQAIQDAKNKVQEIINAHSVQQLTVDNLLGKTEQRIEAGNEAEVKSGIEKDKIILDAKRKLIDSQLAIMEDGEQKSLKVSAESYNRQIEDLRKNGELTKQLKANIEKEAQNEQDKIKTEWAGKRLADDMKLDELEIARMQKLGMDTLKEQKMLLKKQMDAEIAAGGDKVNIALKYQYLQSDLEEKNNDKKIAKFEETIKKESDLITQEYQKKENLLKKDFLNSKRTIKDKEILEKGLAQLKLDSLYEVNEKTIQALEKELATGEMSTEKRAELSNKLTQLRIDNENAVLDASVKTAEEQAKEDEIATQKRIATMEALANATAEIFGAISDFATMKSEQRISELEKEQEAIDATFEKDQANLDNALMSDENRAAKQQELNDKKAAADKVLADKIQAEKIKQAKWEKANAIVQAVITAGLAILKASLTVPFIPMGLIAAGLATTMGAIQIATIASQPIPAYEHGTENHPGGLSLWGEKRAEVAVLPSGKTFLAEKPTLTNFDAGTKIYDSVQAYENAMGKNAINNVVFDYDKMGEKMKPQNIILDSRGLWGIVSQQNSRRTLINRRYSIGK